MSGIEGDYLVWFMVMAVISDYETEHPLKSSMRETPQKVIHLATPKSLKLSYLIGYKLIASSIHIMSEFISHRYYSIDWFDQFSHLSTQVWLFTLKLHDLNWIKLQKTEHVSVSPIKSLWCLVQHVFHYRIFSKLVDDLTLAWPHK